jgi:diguanylate cyclase (GGDEF)-like protein
LRRSVRTTDIVARYGGEEMTIILPHTGLDDAAVVGEKIRGAVEALELPVGGKMIKITISVGVAGFPDCASDPPSLIQEADAAMYRAKQNGRNQVQVASPQPTVAPGK